MPLDILQGMAYNGRRQKSISIHGKRKHPEWQFRVFSIPLTVAYAV
jgi:hypothetical protein